MWELLCHYHYHCNPSCFLVPGLYTHLTQPCHPERSSCFAWPSSYGVEGPPCSLAPEQTSRGILTMLPMDRPEFPETSLPSPKRTRAPSTAWASASRTPTSLRMTGLGGNLILQR